MYILDVRRNIVNLVDKDIEIRSLAEWEKYDYSIVALGPVGGFWTHEEIEIRSEYILHQGTKVECQQFLNELGELLSIQAIAAVSSTRKPTEERLERPIPDTLPF